MDYTASGITNTFEYELVKVFAPHESLGLYDSATGGKITRKWSADYRESLTLDIDGELPPMGALVRVWHTATLGDESERTCLGTFMQESSSLDYIKGRYVGTISLQSCLLRHGTDKRGNNRNIGAGTNVVSLFRSIVSGDGGDPWVDTGLNSSKTFTATHVWEFGESALDELQRCADALGAMIHTSPYGATELRTYLAPGDRPVSWTLTADNLIPSISVSAPEVVNVVQLQYTPQGSQSGQFASAYLPASHPWSMQSIGRHAAKVYQLQQLTKASVSAQAQYLLEQTPAGNKWTATLPYMPLQTGSKGALVYQDVDGVDGIAAYATIDSLEINLDTAMEMQAILTEV